MTASEIYEKAAQKFPGVVSGFNGEAMDPYFVVDANAIIDACLFLRDEPGIKLEVLSDLTAVDFPKDNKLQVVYHLQSYPLAHQIVVKVDLPRDNPHIKTMEGVWKVANWFEREVFDLFGIIFEEHSDLRRIMLPEDWQGHPLRKDYLEQEEYDGISTQREPLVREVLR